MREFWTASGHQLARRNAEGWLEATDELLLAWAARPELVPPPEACEAERALHRRLLAAPRAPIPPEAVAGLADPDARENWTLFLALRDRLIAAGTVEGAYLAIARNGPPLPPLFLGQLVHLILRNALDGCEDAFTLRAAECFWRVQRGTVRDGGLVLSDAERVEELEAQAHAAPLLAMFGPGPEEGLEVLTEAGALAYWSHSDAHTTALPFGAERRAREGMATAIAAFVRHLLRLEVRVEPLVAAQEVDLRWYVGLDAAATAIGDALWRGEEPEGRDRLVGLFRLDFADDARVEPTLRDHPVYLLLALAPDRTLRMKPQNLVVGLPLRAPEALH